MENCYPFTLMPLPYGFDALEPCIDARTVEIHYTKHHQNYVNQLNQALSQYPGYQSWSLEKLVMHYNALPAPLRIPVRNNAGGVYNHNFYWDSMTDCPRGLSPGNLFHAIQREYGSFDRFRQCFTEAANHVFGSGWTWLVVDRTGSLNIISTANQDAPLSSRTTPLLNLDLWEHAYYLQYQNRRSEYINCWWNLVDWVEVEARFDDISLNSCC